MNSMVFSRFHSSLLISISQKRQRSALVTNKPLKSQLPKTTRVDFSLTLNIHDEVNGTLLWIILPLRPRLTEHILSGTLLIAMAKRKKSSGRSCISNHMLCSQFMAERVMWLIPTTRKPGNGILLVPEREQKIFDTLTTINSSITMALTAAYTPMSKFLRDAPLSLLIHIFSYLLECHNWIIS